MPTGTRRRPGDPRGGRYLKYRPPRVLIGRPMDSVRPRSAHRKRRSLFLFLARPGSSMGGLRPSRTPRPINQVAPLPPGRPPAGASGAPAGVLCTGEGAEGACRNSLASSKPSSTCHPVIYLLLPSFFCSCWARTDGSFSRIPLQLFSCTSCRLSSLPPAGKLGFNKRLLYFHLPSFLAGGGAPQIAIWPITGTHAGGQPLAPM